MAERVKYYPIDYRHADAEVPEDSVRFDLPVDADLQRKIVSDDPEIRKITDTALHGRSFLPEERMGRTTAHLIYSTQDNERSNIETRYPFDDIPNLGSKTPSGRELFQLEDRVQDRSEGKNYHFDQLPEVKELQYRFSAIPIIKAALKSSDPERAFESYKTSIEKEPSWDERSSGHQFIIPSVAGGRSWHGFTQFHPSHFWIHERIGGEDEQARRWSTEDDTSTYSTRDFSRLNHQNLNEHYLDSKFRGESLQEHLTNLSSTYNDLWDKLDSGLYVRHPNFWSGHAFAANKNRDSAMQQIQSQAPELKLDLK